MLPFLQKRRSAGLIVETRKADGDKTQAPETPEGGEEDQGLIAAAEAAIRAINAKDSNALAKAWRDGFEILESQPHIEAEHIEGSIE